MPNPFGDVGVVTSRDQKGNWCLFMLDDQEEILTKSLEEDEAKIGQWFERYGPDIFELIESPLKTRVIDGQVEIGIPGLIPVDFKEFNIIKSTSSNAIISPIFDKIAITDGFDGLPLGSLNYFWFELPSHDHVNYESKKWILTSNKQRFERIPEKDLANVDLYPKESGIILLKSGLDSYLVWSKTRGICYAKSIGLKVGDAIKFISMSDMDKFYALNCQKIPTDRNLKFLKEDFSMDKTNLKLLLPDKGKCFKYIVGPGGAFVKEINRETGAYIHVDQDDDPYNFVNIIGSAGNCLKAFKEIYIRFKNDNSRADVVIPNYVLNHLTENEKITIADVLGLTSDLLFRNKNYEFSNVYPKLKDESILSLHENTDIIFDAMEKLMSRLTKFYAKCETRKLLQFDASSAVQAFTCGADGKWYYQNQFPITTVFCDMACNLSTENCPSTNGLPPCPGGTTTTTTTKPVTTTTTTRPPRTTTTTRPITTTTTTTRPTTTTTTTKPTTTTTTTRPVTTTTTHPTTPCCPTWSSWSISQACNDTCGSCGVETRTRTCLTASTCPCSGPTSKTSVCNPRPCSFPRNSCCDPYKTAVVSNSIVCGPLPTDPTDPPSSCSSLPVCPAGGSWSSWTSSCSDTCGMCGTLTRSRTCLSASSGCPCSGSSIETTPERCGSSVCSFPKPTCCTGASRMAINGAFQCVLA